MSIAPGTRLGPYEVTAAIGAGGRGEVYRAHDTTLDRDLAIKVLPDAFASDPERLARFEREAKVLASLQVDQVAHGRGKGNDQPAPLMAVASPDDPARPPDAPSLPNGDEFLQELELSLSSPQISEPSALDAITPRIHEVAVNVR